MSDPVRGSCFCGTVRFEFDLPTSFCAHCHCTMCQRAHGAGYVTWIGVPKARFRVVAGGATLTPFKSSDHGTRSFCANCGSSLFCESTHHPEQIDIVVANLQSGIDRQPESHCHYDSKAGWIPVNDELPKLGGKTGVEPL